jgi:hypothetical protein
MPGNTPATLQHHRLNRRGFLKITGVGTVAMGLSAAPAGHLAYAAALTKARVLCVHDRGGRHEHSRRPARLAFARRVRRYISARGNRKRRELERRCIRDTAAPFAPRPCGPYSVARPTASRSTPEYCSGGRESIPAVERVDLAGLRASPMPGGGSPQLGTLPSKHNPALCKAGSAASIQADRTTSRYNVSSCDAECQLSRPTRHAGGRIGL